MNIFAQITIFLLILYHPSVDALILKAGQVSGNGRGQFGSSDFEGVLSYQRTGSVIDLESEGSKWFFGLHNASFKYVIKDSNVNEAETITDIWVARRFGKVSKKKRSFVAFYAGAGTAALALPTNDNGTLKLESATYQTKMLSVAMAMNKLHYQYTFRNFEASKVDAYVSKGKRISQKVSLDFGRKLKYGVFFEAHQLDLQGEHLNWRYEDTFGAYFGWSF